VVVVLSPREKAEIRQQVYREMIEVERQMVHHGSFRYLCLIAGVPVWTHQPIGPVLRTAR
jgi:hypothetical protein